MNIAQISTINGSLTEGTSMRVSGLSNGLHRQGHSVLALCASGCENLPGNYDKLDSRLLKAHQPGSLLVRLSASSTITDAVLDCITAPLAELCLSAVDSYPILHCHQHFAASLLEKRRTRNQKLLFDYHGALLPTNADGTAVGGITRNRQSNIDSWEAKILDGADGISFVTTHFRDRIVDVKGIDMGKTYVIPDGVDFHHLSQGWNKNEVDRLRHLWNSDDDTIVMYVGSLDSIHGDEYLRSVIRLLTVSGETDINLKFVIVGIGSSAQEFIRLQTRFSDSVVYVPGVSYLDLPTYLAAADILLVPHQRVVDMDNIESGKLLNYLASGKPTVVTRLTATSRFLNDGVDSVLCDPGSPASMMEGILRLANSEDLRNRIGANGQLLVKDKRDWTSIAETSVGVYERLQSQ